VYRALLTSPAARSRAVTLGVFAAYLVLAAVQAWPLPLHFASAFTGEPRGDTGVYIWNMWVFRHELLEGGTPFRTVEILPLNGPADLSLHNYTVFADILALPFLSWLGVVRTFNLIYLLNVALAGFGAYLLIRKITQRPAEAFVGGLLFMWSPFLVTRAMGHFSLVAAAPLPIFVLALYRAWESQRLRDAVLVGLVLVWAAFCDPYYAVYCLMIGACFYGNRLWQISVVRRPMSELRAAKHVVTVAIVALAVMVALIQLGGGGRLRIGPISISMRTLYTPMLVLTVLVGIRVWLAVSTKVSRIPWPSRSWLMRSAIAAGVTVVVLMSPVLSALSSRMVKGGMIATPVMWRSSAPGVDLLSFVVPNPNHPLAPAGLAEWVAKGSAYYIEQVASLSFVGLVLIMLAWRVARYRPPRFWLVLTVGFGVLTLGPFLSIAHVNTYVPTPWALLRYVPVIGAARVPARMDVVVMLGFAVLVACALVAVVNRFPARRRVILCTAALAMAFELFPGPRRLYSAAIPKVYQALAADPRPVRVLRLPTGIKDGLSNIGNFGPQAQYYQTFHGKGLIGGYLSRVDSSSKQFYRRVPVMSALMRLSEGKALEPGQYEAAARNADAFVERSRLGYVVWRNESVTPELRAFAVNIFGLTKVMEADGYELYVPRARH
jgi:hypothetical protein